MEDSRTFKFFSRGPSPTARLAFFAILSLLLLFVDARFKYLESTRSVLAVAVYPLQKIATFPGELISTIAFYIESQAQLVNINTQLLEARREDAVKLGQLQALEMENTQLRALLELKSRATFSTQQATITHLERDIFQRKLFLDKGEVEGLSAGQTVIDNLGVVGQITRSHAWTSEVRLITDKNHAVPVQVVRNGLRALVFGSGDTHEIELRYMPVNVDIEEGDILVTSGIDGSYPPDLPVAKVSKVERNPAYAFARINCVPLSGVDRHRTLMVVTSVPTLPPPPESEEIQDTDMAKQRLQQGQP